jgi:hypothetical protein
LGPPYYLVETDTSQLPASAKEREAPLLHRITVEPAHHGSDARGCGIRTADQSGQHTPARNDSSIIAPVACAHRAQITGWSNVVRAVISNVFPTF